MGGPRLHRHLRRLAGRARRRDGRRDLARRHLHRPVPLLHEHGLAADRRRRRRPRKRGRRLRSARVHHGIRPRDRRGGVALLHGPRRSGPWLRAPGDGGGRSHVGPGLGLGGRARGHRMGRDGLRPRTRASLRGNGELLPVPDLAPKPVGGRQPLPRIHPRHRPEDGPSCLALPDGAGRDLGLHRDAEHHPKYRHDRWPTARRPAPGPQERFLLRARPRHGRAAAGGELRDRQLGARDRSRDGSADPEPGCGLS